MDHIVEEARDALERELDFLEKSAGLVLDLERSVVEVSGDRAVELIAGLLTNDVEGLGIDHAIYSFMLTPKGRPVAEMRVVRRSGGMWLDMPDACVEAVLVHLGRYLPPRLAQFRLAEAWRRLSVVGPRAAEALAALPFVPAPGELASLHAAHAEEPPLGTLIRREPTEGPGFDLYATEVDAWRALLGTAVERVGGGLVGPAAYDAWRIDRGIPMYGREIDPDVLPQETGQEKRAVSFTKGCYTGQEVVARIHYRGHVNRHLRRLRFADPTSDEAGVSDEAGASEDQVSEGPEVSEGAELYDGDRVVGHVTSVARHPARGTIGLGYVRREVEPPADLALEAGGPGTCSVHELGPGRRKAST